MASLRSSQIDRRKLLRLGAFTGLAAVLSPVLQSDQAHADLSPEVFCNEHPRPGCFCNENRPTSAADALQALTEGNERWAAFDQTHPGEDEERRKCVADHGQTPYAAIISCSDSRVPPELVFDQGIGDLFVARVAGNVATGTLAESLYYGTSVLGARILFVMGHSDCGAVKEAVKYFPGTHDLEFVRLIRPAVVRARQIVGSPYPDAKVVPEAIRQNVLLGVRALRKDPLFKDLLIAGGVYDLKTSRVNIVIQ